MHLKSYITEYVSSGRGRKKSDFNQISKHTDFDEFLELIQSDGYVENRSLVSLYPGASEEKTCFIYRYGFIDSSDQIGILNPDKPDYTFTVYFGKNNKICRVDKYKFKLNSRTLERKRSSIDELIDYLS